MQGVLSPAVTGSQTATLLVACLARGKASLHRHVRASDSLSFGPSCWQGRHPLVPAQRERQGSNQRQQLRSFFASGFRAGVLTAKGRRSANRWPGVRVVAGRRGFMTELDNIRDEKNVAGPLEFTSPLEIVLYPDPRLRAVNKRINVFDQKLKQLVDEMFDLMYNTEGVGLAAPQVGVNVQLMVYNPAGERGQGREYALVNPKITKYTKEMEFTLEGCLSFPTPKPETNTIEADVKRPSGVKVEAQDLTGRKFILSLKGWQARIFQHEYDHLEAVLFHDRMTPEILETVREELEFLEAAYEARTGKPAPERVATRAKKMPQRT